MNNPLQGKRILITRERQKAKELAEKVTKLGGSPIVVPLIEISYGTKTKELAVLEKLSSFEWILITSANGVHGFFQLLQEQNRTLPEHIKIGVVGRKTEEALAVYGYKASFVPTTFDAVTMAEELISNRTLFGSILLIRGNLSRPVLPEAFDKQQIAYQTLVVYHTDFCMKSKEALNNAIPEADFITFTSPSTVDAFTLLTDAVPDTATSICIGATTEARAKEARIPNVYTASPYTTDAMLSLIQEIINKKG